MAKMDEQFIQDVLNTVDLIPFGLVASYGQIAFLSIFKNC